MAEFPAGVYSPRLKENRSGVVYEPEKSTKNFAEDIIKLDDEVVALENEMGLYPKGGSASIREALQINPNYNNDHVAIGYKRNLYYYGSDSSLEFIDLEFSVYIVSIEFPVCTLIDGDINLINLDNLTVLNLNSLYQCQSIDIESCISISSIEFANLNTAQSISIDSNTALYSFIASNLTSCDSISIYNNIYLTSVNLSILSAISMLYCIGNISLTSITLAENISALDIDFYGCSLPESEVDRLLALFDNAGYSNGVLNISGGSNAIPSSAGLTSKANLESKGWTVTVSTS